MIDKEETSNFVLTTNFSKVKNFWIDQNKISKKLNSHITPISIEDPSKIDFELSNFTQNTLLYEYLLNPKEIKIIPISL